MNKHFRPFFVSILLVIGGTVSYSSTLMAQDLNNLKPTRQNEVIPQTPRTSQIESQNTPSDVSPDHNLDTQTTPSSSTPTNCQGTTPSVRQPGMTKPNSILNPSDSKTPINQGVDPLRPSPTIPQSQPITPNQ